MARPRTDARTQLLAEVVDHLARTGVAGLSLRDLAASIGTSHRMLVYHFGSKAGLLAEVVRHVEANQRAQLEALAAGSDNSTSDSSTGGGTAQRIRAMWSHWVDPATQAQERLFFEMVGMALQGDPAMQPLLDDLILPWLEPMTALRRAAGVDEAAARSDARLALAVTRGLLLDLLATGDVEATTLAFERFGQLLRAAEPARADRVAGSGQRERKRSS
jgi:AcrR family transcriptional regulator